MKVLVYPHDLAIGGSQLNAIELAAAVQNLGNDVVVYGQPGPLVDRIHALGLEFLPSPPVHRRPTPSVATHLRRTVKERGIEMVHAYEWPPALESVLACAGVKGATAMATVMSMSVAPFIPINVPLLVGTEQIADAERAFGRPRVGVLEPPVDTLQNDPSVECNGGRFLESLGATAGVFTVSIVSRLAHEMKLEGILCAIAAVERLNGLLPIQLVIAGDGPARDEVRRQAAASNQAIGVQRIFLAGELEDPRPAYACADVSVGMGGSALRAMAFGLPLVVQGEHGFWELLDEETVGTFLWQGWYGVGTGTAGSEEKLTAILHRLAMDPQLCARLGGYGRKLVLQRFSLEGAARQQLAFYQEAQDLEPGGPVAAMANSAGSAARFLLYKGAQAQAKLARRNTMDDFNATAVAKKAVSMNAKALP